VPATTSGPWRKMFQSLGMPIAYMTSDEQDHTTALFRIFSCCVIRLANAVLAIEDRNIIFDLASGGFQSTVRLAKSSPEMWSPIFWQNRDYIYEALEVFIHHLKRSKKSQKRRSPGLSELIVNANKIRGYSKVKFIINKNEETIIKLYTK